MVDKNEAIMLFLNMFKNFYNKKNIRIMQVSWLGSVCGVGL